LLPGLAAHERSGDRFNPSWSWPDGDKIAFHSDRGPPRESSQIFVMNADGSGEPTRVTFTRAADFNPSWAPDAAELVFQSNAADGVSGHDDIYVCDATGKDQDLLRLTNAPEADITPDWSHPPDAAARLAALAAAGATGGGGAGATTLGASAPLSAKPRTLPFVVAASSPRPIIPMRRSQTSSSKRPSTIAPLRAPVIRASTVHADCSARSTAGSDTSASGTK
jgi:dipeptidyl aminopeptidase/acylaminoacyl peptidase